MRIQAVPSDGWKFKCWKDSAGIPVDTEEVHWFTATEDDTSFTAEFAQITVIVTGEASPVDGGTVEGGGTFNEGDSVTLTATTNIGWRFDHWEDSSHENPRTFEAPDVDTTYTATFVQQVTIETEAVPEEGGTVTGGGTYDLGESVTLTATTNSGWRFVHWEDDSTNLSRTITADEDATYTATFVEQVEVETEADPTNGGFVLGAGTYDAGSLVTLIATTNSGWRFNGWFHDGFITNSPVFVTVASPSLEGLITYTAKFVQTVTVTGLANPTNAGSVAGGRVCDVGDTNVILTATAFNGWAFVRWNDGTTNNPYHITAPVTDITYAADFTSTNPPTITIIASDGILTLAWPIDNLSWILQAKTNDLSSAYWFDLPGTGASNSAVISVDPVNTAVFYRLRQP